MGTGASPDGAAVATPISITEWMKDYYQVCHCSMADCLHSKIPSTRLSHVPYFPFAGACCLWHTLL